MTTDSRLRKLVVAGGWVVTALFVCCQFYQEKRLDTAPVALARVQRFSKNTGKTTSYFAQVAFRPPDDTARLVLTKVRVDMRLYDRRHLYDTLAIRYLPSHPETAAYLSSDTSIIWLAIMVGFALLAVGSAYWHAHWSAKLQSWQWFQHSWHGSLALLGAGTLAAGLRGCIDWSGRNGQLGPYYQGPHVLGRVVGVSKPGTPPGVYVAFRPPDEPVPFEARLRLLPLPAVYYYTFEQALALGWQPQVEVWYPEHRLEQVQLLLQLQPTATEQKGSSNGLLVVMGFVLLMTQIRLLERWHYREHSEAG